MPSLMASGSDLIDLKIQLDLDIDRLCVCLCWMGHRLVYKRGDIIYSKANDSFSATSFFDMPARLCNNALNVEYIESIIEAARAPPYPSQRGPATLDIKSLGDPVGCCCC